MVDCQNNLPALFLGIEISPRIEYKTQFEATANFRDVLLIRSDDEAGSDVASVHVADKISRIRINCLS